MKYQIKFHENKSHMVQIFTAQKIKFSIKGFFSKCDQIRRKLVTFTEEIFNGKLHFLCSDCKKILFSLFYTQATAKG